MQLNSFLRVVFFIFDMITLFINFFYYTGIELPIYRVNGFTVGPLLKKVSIWLFKNFQKISRDSDLIVICSVPLDCCYLLLHIYLYDFGILPFLILLDVELGQFSDIIRLKELAWEGIQIILFLLDPQSSQLLLQCVLQVFLHFHELHLLLLLGLKCLNEQIDLGLCLLELNYRGVMLNYWGLALLNQSIVLLAHSNPKLLYITLKFIICQPR